MKDCFRDDRVYIIAEVGNTHEGSVWLAKRIIDGAAMAEADAIKFQIFTADELLVPNHSEYQDFKGYELSENQWQDVMAYAKNSGLEVWVDVFGERSACLSKDFGADAFKVHSSDLPNTPLLRLVGSFEKPVVISTGGSTTGEIRVALSTLKESGNERLGLLVGFQAFPTKLEHSSLRLIRFYREQFGVAVGYADHVDAADAFWAQTVPLMAVAAGASIIEKHITFDRRIRRTDVESSLEPGEFQELVNRIRQAEMILGQARVSLSEDEASYAYRMKKKMVARGQIQAGTKLTRADLAFKRFELPIFTPNFDDVLGREVVIDVRPDEVITLAKVHVKTVVLVQARMDSRRFPGKVLVPIVGRPALARLLDRLKRCKSAESLVVCTTDRPIDHPIVELAEKEGAKCFCGSKDDVMGRLIAAAEREEADLIVRVSGDDILTDPEYIDRAVRTHREVNADYTRMVGLPWGVEKEVVSLSALKRARQWIDDFRYAEWITTFLNNPEQFKIATICADERHRRPQYRLTIDYPEDIVLMEALFQRLDNGSGYLDLSAIVELLDSSPELVSINAHYGTCSPPPEGLRTE